MARQRKVLELWSSPELHSFIGSALSAVHVHIRRQVILLSRATHSLNMMLLFRSTFVTAATAVLVLPKSRRFRPVNQ